MLHSTCIAAGWADNLQLQEVLFVVLAVWQITFLSIIGKWPKSLYSQGHSPHTYASHVEHIGNDDTAITKIHLALPHSCFANWSFGLQEEDDGVVLSTVLNPHGQSFLLLLDGSSWQELARAQLPYGMAYMFHGQFIPG